MISKIKKLGGIEDLTKSQQNSILGGQSCAITSNTGVVVHGAPNDNQSTQNHACANQGGPSGTTLCVGNK